MNHIPTTGARNAGSPGPARAHVLLAAIACTLTLFVAGALVAKVQTGGTGRTEFGSIEAFGSIVVNGIHYDETAALITIDGVANQPPSALKLGMVVQIDGSLDNTTLRGVADTVNVNRTLFGQLENNVSGSGELTLLSQTVTVNAFTRFDGAPGATSLSAGDWIAVHGLEDPGKKTLVATLVEKLVVPPGAASTIRGSVRNAHGGQFRIGKLVISAAGLASPNDGDYVAVSGRYAPGAGNLNADQVTITREVETSEDNETEITGFVADYRSGGSFVVAGVAVDASRATIEGGRIQDLKNDVLVTVEGRISNGVLVASEIELATVAKSAKSANSSTELEGVVSAFNSLSDFVVKGTRVDAGSAVIVNKSRRPVGQGLKAHIKGRTNPDGTLRARAVSFEAP